MFSFFIMQPSSKCILKGFVGTSSTMVLHNSSNSLRTLYLFSIIMHEKKKTDLESAAMPNT